MIEAVSTDIIKIIEDGRAEAYHTINTSMVEAYWLVGKRIAENELEGYNRSEYGKDSIKEISQTLSAKFGKSFSPPTLSSFKQFYNTFPDVKLFYAQCRNLSWSHNRQLMRVIDEDARTFYLMEAAALNWSVQTLEHHINNHYYQRVVAPSKPNTSKSEELGIADETTFNSSDFIRNPNVLEFLHIPVGRSYADNESQQCFIDDIKQYLLELDKGFAFVAKKKHVYSKTTDFFIDLVFYNYILKCFVIVEIVSDKTTPEDLELLNTYVEMFDELERNEGDNPTIGILLGTDKDSTTAKYSVINDTEEVFANKYLPHLPSEEELAAEIDREKLILRERGLL